jgi:hypothetical protein
MGQTLGLYQLSEPTCQWQAMTKYRESHLIYVRDKNKHYWVGNMLDRLELDLVEPEMIGLTNIYPPINESFREYDRSI